MDVTTSVLYDDLSTLGTSKTTNLTFKPSCRSKRAQKKDGCGGGLQVGRDQLHTPALTVIGLLAWLFPFFVNGDNPGGADGDSQSITVCALDDIHAASRADCKARQHPSCSYRYVQDTKNAACSRVMGFCCSAYIRGMIGEAEATWWFHLVCHLRFACVQLTGGCNMDCLLIKGG